MILRELIDQIKIENIAGSQINPATNEKLDELKVLLTQIEDAVDGLELTADNINLNTDTLEAKIQSVRDQLDVLLSTRASESTNQSILNALGETSGTNLLNELQSILSNLSTGVATENTLIEVRDYLDTVETKLQSIIDSLDVNLSTRASETTLGSVLTELQSIDSKDFATETTLALTKIAIDAINTDIDVALSTRASESTLNLVRIAVQAIDTDLDVALSTRSSEVTLLLVKTNLDNVKTKLDTLIATDFSTESTLAEVRDAIGQISGTDVITELQIISKSTSLHNKFNPGKFFNLHLKNAGSFEMNVNGSVTPVDFIFTPQTNKHVFISRLIIMIEDNKINFNKFGGVSSLTNGFFITVKEDGIKRNLHDAIIKKNSNFHMLAYDVEISSASTDLLTVRWSFFKSGTYLHLHDNTADNFKVTIADNLTGLTTFHMALQGFEVDE